MSRILASLDTSISSFFRRNGRFSSWKCSCNETFFPYNEKEKSYLLFKFRSSLSSLSRGCCFMHQQISFLQSENRNANRNEMNQFGSKDEEDIAKNEEEFSKLLYGLKSGSISEKMENFPQKLTRKYAEESKREENREEEDEEDIALEKSVFSSIKFQSKIEGNNERDTKEESLDDVSNSEQQFNSLLETIRFNQLEEEFEEVNMMDSIVEQASSSEQDFNKLLHILSMNNELEIVEEELTEEIQAEKGKTEDEKFDHLLSKLKKNAE